MCTNSKLPWAELLDTGMFAGRPMFESTRIFAAQFQKLFSRWISRRWPIFLAQLLTTNLNQEEMKYNCLLGWLVHCSGPLYPNEQLTVKLRNNSPHNIAATFFGHIFYFSWGPAMTEGVTFQLPEAPFVRVKMAVSPHFCERRPRAALVDSNAPGRSRQEFCGDVRHSLGVVSDLVSVVGPEML